MMCVWQQKADTLVDADGNFDLRQSPQVRSKTAAASARSGVPATPARARTRAAWRNSPTPSRKFFIENSRLGIPVIFHEECLHGHAAIGGTSFPATHRTRRHVRSRTRGVAVHHDRRRGPRRAARIRRSRRWSMSRAIRAGAASRKRTAKIRILVSRMGIAAVRGFQGDATFRDKTPRDRHPEAFRRSRPARIRHQLRARQRLPARAARDLPLSPSKRPSTKAAPSA